MWIIPSIAEAAKIFPLWLKQREVIAGGSSPRGRTVFMNRKLTHGQEKQNSAQPM